MELMFNELSTEPLADDQYQANEKMQVFAQTVKIAREHGFNKVRSEFSSAEIMLAKEYSLHSWLTDKVVSPEYKNFLFGTITQPFINEEDEAVEDAYIMANYYFEDEENNVEKTKCLGLAAAYLYPLPAISLNSPPTWSKNQLAISVVQDEQASIHQVYNVFSKECFEKETISEFIETLGEIELIEADIKPEEKDIHLADHHGKKELKAFWQKIQNSPYVTSARSTDWGRSKAIIRDIQEDGTFDFILQKTARKYALKVQTTGRNYRETKAIAKILEKEYS